MKKISLEIEIFEKIATNTLYTYVFVPRNAINSIKEKGLLSPLKLIEDKEALKLARPDDYEKFKKSVEDKLKDPEWEFLESGVSSFFTLPDWSKLPKSHFIFKWNLVPIQINLSLLLEEHPETKLYGVELEKYNPQKKQKNREKYLTVKEIKNYIEELPEKIWENYDTSKKKMYAPDVPHLFIITEMKKIPSKYLLL